MHTLKILALESSCDETAAAVVEDGRKVLSNIVSSQIQTHRIYGGHGAPAGVPGANKQQLLHIRFFSLSLGGKP